MAFTSSSNSITVPHKTTYDVFVSFRGSDTRQNFTSHLYVALKKKHIEPFIDDHGLQRGEEISSTLLKAIETSKISVIIFSENYASSRWCLDELLKIMKCMKTTGLKVVPIFYHVEPSDVRKQSGKFGEAFGIIKAKFKESRVKRWSIALTEAANISGWDSSNFRAESELVEKVADHIMKKLYAVFFTTSTDLVGMDSHVEQILSRLSIGSEEVRFVGIWGMGGIGKTTIAEVIYGQICDQFDCCCFFRDVREKSEKYELVHLRKTFYFELLGNEDLELQMLHVLPTFIKDLLSRKKVLAVLDDVNNPSQLEALDVSGNWYGAGSRIILTSRDKQVLKASGIDDDGIYMVEGLNDDDSLRLLCKKAFKQNHSPVDYTDLSLRVLNYAKGVPLALKVLGSHLCKRSIDEWEIVLNKLEQFPDSNIQKILEISYKDLDQEEKDIFLDIACFFKGCNRTLVESILNGCGFPSRWGIMRLEDKCLIVIVDNILEMHDLIRGMGQDIARREGSRLWNPQVICNMLRTDMGNKEIQGIFLDMSETGQLQLNPAAFSRMSNLRLLKFYHSSGCPTPCCRESNESTIGTAFEFVQSNYLQCLPNKLSLLHWENYPFSSLPTNFFMQNIVKLIMTGSNLRYLWDGDMCLQNLKRLDLSQSKQLLGIPNLSSATNLNWLNLRDCVSLVDVPSSIHHLHKLADLILSGCRSLRSLPSLIQLKLLKNLYLSQCSNLKMLPEIPTRIQYLFLDNSGVEEWFPSTQFFNNLRLLNMLDCKNITRIPSNVHLDYSDARVNWTLHFSCCQNLQKLPVITGFLKELYLGWTGLQELPASIGCLSSLEVLMMRDCKSLEILSDSICQLKCLEKLILNGCSKLGKLPPLYGLCSLRELHLDETALVEVPNDIVSLSSLIKLNLYGCNRLQFLPELPSQLMELQVDNSKLLEVALSSSFSAPAKYWSDQYSFYYWNCLKLDQHARCNIIADAKLRITEIATSNSRRHILCSFNLVLPGSEIPEWFSYQTQGSSMDIRFPPSCFDSTFKGFAFCVVFESKYPSFRCSCYFRSVIDEKYTLFEPHIMRFNGDPESDHLLIWYGKTRYFQSLKDWLIENNCNAVEASFEFKQDVPYFYRQELKVKRCGIHLIYSKDEHKGMHTKQSSKQDSSCTRVIQ